MTARVPTDHARGGVLHPLVTMRQQRLRRAPHRVFTRVLVAVVAFVALQRLRAERVRLLYEQQRAVTRLPVHRDVVVVLLAVSHRRVVLRQRGDDRMTRGGDRARRVRRRRRDRDPERLHRRASQALCVVAHRRAAAADGAPPRREVEELLPYAAARGALQQDAQRLARGGATLRVFVRAEPRDEGDEQEDRVRVDDVFREPSDDVARAPQRVDAAGGVDVFKVRRERLQVRSQAALAERVVQEELDERARARTPRFVRVRAHDEPGHDVHRVVNFRQKRPTREHRAHEREHRRSLFLPVRLFQVREREAHDEAKLRVRGRERGVALQEVVQKF